MRNRFDQLCKQIAQEALRLSGVTAVHDEILPEPQYADIRHEPDPACAAARARLGLLGRIASSLCLIEIYSGAPDGAALRACLGKHLAFWQHRARKSRRRERPRRAFAEPTLWIVAAGRPTSLLSRLGLVPAPGWPRGVYLFGADVLRVGIIAASELPREPSTLLVRLMAAGPLLPRAIDELNALPADAIERAVAEEILLRWNNALERKPSPTAEEQEAIMYMRHTFSEARALASEKATQKTLASNLLTVLRVRGIPVPSADRARIRAERDPDRLQRWLERAVVEASLDAVLGAGPTPKARTSIRRRGAAPAGLTRASRASRTNRASRGTARSPRRPARSRPRRR